MDASYAEIGTWVILGKHKRFVGWDGFSWNPDMEKYVGQKTTIKHVYHDVITVCQVACDRGWYYWRVEDMILASDVPLLTPEQKEKLRIK